MNWPNHSWETQLSKQEVQMKQSRGLDCYAWQGTSALAYLIWSSVVRKKVFIALAPEAIFLVVCDPSMNEL
jgi:hypothetical protein